jgi:hypothetical protein
MSVVQNFSRASVHFSLALCFRVFTEIYSPLRTRTVAENEEEYLNEVDARSRVQTPPRNLISLLIS